jgi:hypothetical protein
MLGPVVILPGEGLMGVWAPEATEECRRLNNPRTYSIPEQHFLNEAAVLT